MTDTPITKTQLNALERAADKVFGKLGIDIEFTRHFLDRVNDERNQKQITIQELGMLFAKEYKRWGRKIANMPIDSQAVMKDLSTELNIPFVLNKDGKETDLVAKTVMRKKHFTTPDPELPVESVEETVLPPKARASRAVATYTPWKSGIHVTGKYSRQGKGQKLDFFAKSEEEAIQMLINKMGISPDRIKLTPAEVTEDKHGARKGTQVKGSDATPQMSKPTRKGSSPHPMRGKLVGEDASAQTAAEFIKGLRNDGWNVYVSKVNHGVEGAYRVELEHGGQEIMIIGKGSNWELFADGPTLSGRGKQFDSLESAFQAATSVGEETVNERTRKDPTDNAVDLDSVTDLPGGETGSDAYDQVELKNAINEILPKLAARDRKVIELRFGLNGNRLHTLKQIGEIFGVSDDRIRQIEARAMKQLRHPSKARKIRPFLEDSHGFDLDPLDFCTPEVQGIAAYHGVDELMIATQLVKGIEVEMEHTSDMDIAREIALDHLAEMPDYYTKLSDMEGGLHEMLTAGIWEMEQALSEWERQRPGADPREMILNKALHYLDKMVEKKGDKQDISGYAFDIVRSFNLSGIANARELARLYHEWKGTTPHGGIYESKPTSSDYAIGMSQAMKSTGDKKPLKKSTIKKGHKIARAVAKGDARRK